MPYTQEQGKAIVQQFNRLREIRSPLDKEYRDCYDYSYPSLGAGFMESMDGVSNAQTTRARNADKFDTTATEGVRLLASSVLSSMTPPNTRWFDLAPPVLNEEELEQDAKEWLEDSAARLHTMIHASNYDSEAIEFMHHQMVAGMAGIYVELKDSKFHFQTWPLNHLYCQETLNNGYIDTVYRQFQFTAQQAVVEFGIDALPDHIKDCYKQDENSTKKFMFVVAIRPRIIAGVQASGTTAKNLPWESVWVSACGTVVRESGFHEMPAIVPRWMKIPDTDYARGPVFDALPDIKSLNKIKENMLLNMDMHITGMFKVKDDGVINPNNIKFGARRVIPVGDIDNLQPLASGGDIDAALAQIAGLQQSIRRVLLADQLGPTEKAIQTATEVQTRNNQVRQILGPIFARLQSEYLTHLVARCFGLAARAGLLAPMPESLRAALASRGSELEIEYRSPLARSQKMQELTAVDEFTTRMQALAQVDPGVLDFINLDNVAQKYGALLGIDPGLMNDTAAVQKVRYQRQQREQAAMQAQQAIAVAQASAQQQPAEATGLNIVE